VARFFRSGIDSEARLAALQRYGATKILVESRLFELLPELSRTFGEPLYQGTDYALFDAEGF
jgi:hypothetical protein